MLLANSFSLPEETRFTYLRAMSRRACDIDVLVSIVRLHWVHILPCALCLQPEGSFRLTVTWTPTEDGGIRELIIFNANGVLKHQAVMLGRAEAPKKKKVNILIPQLNTEAVLRSVKILIDSDIAATIS